MPLYVAQCNIPNLTQEQLLTWQQAAIATCAQFRQWGRPVRFVRGLLVPSESLCLCLFESPDGAHVRDVSEAAQIPFTRIVEALELSR